MHELNNETIRLITSTQVITSISSVVKELVENSLDAHAESIEVKLENDGLTKIEVQDNGTGISKDEIEKICLPHFTSKITSEKDLLKLISYGFRGEALASMCAVSDVFVVTRTKNDDIAYCHNFDSNGKLLNSKPSHNNIGTMVTINNIFKSLPVRKQIYQNKKQLKHELKVIEELLMSFSLLYPKSRFILRKNKNLIFEKHRTSSIEGVMSNLFGANILKSFNKISFSSEDFNLQGYIPSRNANPDVVGRAVNDRIFISVNNRPVKIKEISSLLKQFFREHCCSGNVKRFPIAIIQLEVAQHLVDVNVEPNKNVVNIEVKNEVLDVIARQCQQVYVNNSQDGDIHVDVQEISKTTSINKKANEKSSYLINDIEFINEYNSDKENRNHHQLNDSESIEENELQETHNHKIHEDQQHHVDLSSNQSLSSMAEVRMNGVVNTNENVVENIINDNNKTVNETADSEEHSFEESILILNDHTPKNSNSSLNLNQNERGTVIVSNHAVTLSSDESDNQVESVNTAQEQHDVTTLYHAATPSSVESNNLIESSLTSTTNQNEQDDVIVSNNPVTPCLEINNKSNFSLNMYQNEQVDVIFSNHAITPSSEIDMEVWSKGRGPCISLENEDPVKVIGGCINTVLKYDDTTPILKKIRKRSLDPKEHMIKKKNSPKTTGPKSPKFDKLFGRKKCRSDVDWNQILKGEDTMHEKAKCENIFTVVGRICNTTLWILNCNNKLFFCDRKRLSEMLLYKTLCNKHKFEPKLLERPINFDQRILGNKRCSFLLDQKEELFDGFNCRYLKLDQLILNGIFMKRKTNYMNGSFSIQVTHLPKLFANEIDNEDILKLIDNSIEGVAMENRPAVYKHWCHNEAVRLTQLSTNEYSRSELRHLIDDVTDCHDIRDFKIKSSNNELLFHEFYDVSKR